jgi:hypothetical protein
MAAFARLAEGIGKKTYSVTAITARPPSQAKLIASNRYRMCGSQFDVPPLEPRVSGASFYNMGTLVLSRSSLADVRFTPESGQSADVPACPLCAKSGHLHCSRFLIR